MQDLIKLARDLHKVIKVTKSVKDNIDSQFPNKISEIINDSSICAATSAVASGWIPGAGSAIAATISAGFIWTMYGRINTACGIPLGDGIVKSLASGVATNLLSYIAGGMIVSTALSFLPGIGSIGAAGIIGATCYALTYVSGLIYIKLLTNLLKEGIDPSGLSDYELKDRTQQVINSVDIKSTLESAKKSYKR